MEVGLSELTEIYSEVREPSLQPKLTEPPVNCYNSSNCHKQLTFGGTKIGKHRGGRVINR